jgi:SAM-dependent methyltransferase
MGAPGPGAGRVLIPMDPTIDYYERNAEAFERDTARLDMEHLYQPFLDLLPPGGRILDAGCGPGRDSKAFFDRGYEVLSFDASPGMVELASRRTGGPSILLRFEEVEFADEFDGIWASASLLHVPRAQLDDAFRRLLRAAKDRGVIYASFKCGTGERVKEGRLFSDFTEDTLAEFVGQFPGVEILRLWQTMDMRPGRSDDVWVNVLARKR